MNLRLVEIIRSKGTLEPMNALEHCFLEVVNEMLTTDHMRGLHGLMHWADWLSNCDNRTIETFPTLDSFLEHRVRNVGYQAMRGMLPYVMDMDISDADEKAIWDFHDAAGRSVCLTNDYLSWTKELRQAEKGYGHIMNTVTLLMRVEGLEMDDAHARVRELAMEYEGKALKHRDRMLRSNLSEHIKRYLHALCWMVGGTVLWSVTCPRYNSEYLEK